MTDTTITPIVASPRQNIRASWIDYIGNATYDLTRSALDFIPQGLLTPVSNFSKNKSTNDFRAVALLKNLLETVTNFVLPKISATTNLLSNLVSSFTAQTLGRFIGQVSPKAKQTPYELDANKMGPINRAVTNFAVANVKYMLLGALTFMGAAQPLFSITPEYNLLFTRVGGILASLLTGAGIGLAANQLLPRMASYISSKRAPKTVPSPTAPVENNTNNNTNKPSDELVSTPKNDPELKEEIATGVHETAFISGEISGVEQAQPTDEVKNNEVNEEFSLSPSTPLFAPSFTATTTEKPQEEPVTVLEDENKLVSSHQEENDKEQSQDNSRSSSSSESSSSESEEEALPSSQQVNTTRLHQKRK